MRQGLTRFTAAALAGVGAMAADAARADRVAIALLGLAVFFLVWGLRAVARADDEGSRR